MTGKHVEKAIIPLLVILVLATLSAKVGVAPPPQENSSSNAQARFASFNSKARLAKSGDERAVRDLADEVFTEFGYSEVAGVLSLFKDRLVRAEINYRRTGNGGIPERNVVRMLNGLTKELGAPDYARVSVHQVRYLRVNLLPVFPSFIGHSSTRQSNRSIIDPEMSPLEATGLTLLLVTQKLANEDFQVTPEEWTARRHQKAVAKWEAHRNGIPAPMEESTEAVARVESGRTKELKAAFLSRAVDILPSVDRSLEVLGIPR
jgi:hypothetical protein